MDWYPYIRLIADQLQLRDWIIVLEDEPVDDENHHASCFVYTYAKKAKIRLGPIFKSDKLSLEDARATIVHELLHCHFGHAHNWAQNNIKYKYWEAYVRFEEVGIESLAQAIAPYFPLPKEP